MTPYPQSLPLDCITRIVGLIRNREVSANKAEFFHCVWEVQGFAQKSLVGDADHSFGASPVVGYDAELRDCCAALKDFHDDGESFGATAADESLDPATIIMLVQVAIALIQKLLNRKES